MIQPIQTLFIQYKNGIDFRIINEIKLNEPCIEFAAITSDPEFIRDLLCPGLVAADVLVINKDHSLPNGQPFYKSIIAEKKQYIPIILVDNTITEILPLKSENLPLGVFMAIPAQRDSSIAETIKTDNYLRQSIIYTANAYRRLSGKQVCCNLHNSASFQLIDSSLFLRNRPNYQEKKESVLPKSEFVKLPPSSLTELQDKKYKSGLPKIAHPSLLAIGISTGGPEALKTLLQGLPSNFPVPILLVQHLHANFIRSFLDTLRRFSPFKLELAEPGMLCKPSTIYLPPAKVHMGIESYSRKQNIVLKLSDFPQLLNGHMPSVGYLFTSIAESNLAGSAVAIIMTGMGADGAVEIGSIKKAGGITFAQDESSSSIFGMPKAAIQLGNVHHAVPLELLADLLKDLFRVPTKC